MEYAYEMEAGMAAAELFSMGMYGVVYLLQIALGIAMYVLQAWGLYTIATRRQLKNPWLAWLPVGNMWILGSIADQYQYVVQGKVRSRRKVLLGLTIALDVLAVILIVAMTGMLVNMIINIPEMEYMPESEALALVLKPLLTSLGIMLVFGVVAVVAAVFQYIALYDLYRSCEPKNGVLYLVLSIFIANLLPVFVFLCRSKDEGMPPRKDDPLPQLPAEDPPAQGPEF